MKITKYSKTPLKNKYRVLYNIEALRFLYKNKEDRILRDALLFYGVNEYLELAISKKFYFVQIIGCYMGHYHTQFLKLPLTVPIPKNMEKYRI